MPNHNSPKPGTLHEFAMTPDSAVGNLSRHLYFRPPLPDDAAKFLTQIIRSGDSEEYQYGTNVSHSILRKKDNPTQTDYILEEIEANLEELGIDVVPFEGLTLNPSAQDFLTKLKNEGIELGRQLITFCKTRLLWFNRTDTDEGF